MIKEDIMEDKKALSDEELEGVSGGNTGKVVWYNSRKGFGSLAEDGSKDEVMVLARNNPGLSLNVGQHVAYDVTETDQGRIATNVRII